KGRPRKLTESDARFAVISLARTRHRTAADLQRDYFPTVHPTTIRRALRHVGLRAYFRRKVPFINSRN
ncbi:hypothetical protein BDV93DRAFT_422329, partial [Ceratobasidium sp. AG-I]